MPPPTHNRGKPGSKANDTSKSNERNEYIPSFIAKKPFYIDDATASDSDYLEHQRLQSQKNHDPLATATWYDRGTKAGPAATKYRKGACANCGSLNHTAKDCLQRKRKHGAKWTGRDIAADEAVKEVKLGWDAKRDRWNGYEAADYQRVVDEYNELEAMKRELTDPTSAAPGPSSSSSADADVPGSEGARYGEETSMGRTQASSTRNLRLREDTAKYLKNLDLDSARYDPKTRSMQGGGDGDPVDPEDATSGFARPTAGEAAEFERAQKYAWESQERGGVPASDRMHMQANPTEAMMIRKRKLGEEEERRGERKRRLAETYGSQEGVSKAGVLGAAGKGEVESSERFVEYDARGRVKGKEVAEKGRYEEDVRTLNHTEVWGSWWEEGRWGFKCCRSTVRNSYCTGERGREIAEAEEERERGKGALPTAEEAGNVEVVGREEAWEEERRAEAHVPNGVDAPGKSRMDESRRRLEEMKAGVSEEEMERYRRERLERNDPMTKMLGKEELVEA